MLPLLLISSLLFTTAQSSTNPCAESTDIYYEPDHLCLKWYSQVAKQNEAKAECTRIFGTILNVLDQTKEDFVKTTIDGLSYVEPTWINLEQTSAEFEVQGGGGSLGGYTAWVTAPGDDLTGGECVSRDNAGGWIIELCSSMRAYFCEIPGPPPPECDPGWYLNKAMDTCYKAVKKRKKTFVKAIVYCEKIGGRLSKKLAFRTERREAMSLMKFQGHFWIGVQSPNKNGQFEDLDGNAVDANQFFKKTAPKTNGHCVSIKKGRLYSKDCPRRQFFICQKNPS